MTLTKEQREVYSEAKDILNKWGMCYLALRPRFGKSLIAAELIRGTKSIIVTTKSAIPGFKKVLKAMDVDAIVCTYGTAHKHIDRYDNICVDEAHSNISSYPKMSKSREKLQLIIDKNKDINIILMSGSPSIESGSQLFHQLNLSPKHKFSKYKDFYTWWNHRGHYSDGRDCGGYGIEGSFKYTGGPRPVIDYSKVINFENEFNHIMIRKAESETAVEVILRYVEATEIINEGISSIKTKNIFMLAATPFIANGGASKMTKVSQLAGGTCIADDDEAYIISPFKAQHISELHKDSNCCVFYKYKKERELLEQYFNKDDIYQIDSNCTGLDLSHYDEMVIYSLSWSGANYLQVLNRLVNVNREDTPKVYIYLTVDSYDKTIYRAVSNKRDVNTKMLS